VRHTDLPVLLLWLGAACATAGAPSAMGHLSSAGEPAAWTLDETAAALREAIKARSADHADRRLTTAFYVSDQAAADRLTDWFRGRPEVDAVELRDGASHTHVRGGGTEQDGAVQVAEAQWWELVVAGAPGPLTQGDVAGWLRLLRAVPADMRWRLGPSDTEE
jgi:short subunit dehydrogenase-like uncharacterized protein